MSAIFAKRDFLALHNIAIEFGGLWGIDEKLEFINDSENIVYMFRESNLFLRLTETNHRLARDIQSEINFIQYLSQFTHNISRPQPSQNNRLLETLPYKNGSLTACLFSGAPGEQIKDLDILKTTLPHDLGILAGELHYQSKKFSLNRSEYVNNDHIENYQLYLKDDQSMRECEKALNWYHSLPRSKDTFGPIHGDIHFGNMSYCQKEGITLFDFDDCSNGFYIFDLGIHLYYAQGMFTFKDGLSHYENYKRKFLAAYKSKNSLEPSWYDLIDDVIRFRTIDLYAWMHKMFDFSNLTTRQRETLYIYKRRIIDSENSDYKKL